MIAEKLMDFTKSQRPDLYEAILHKIQPYSLESVLRIMERHLAKVPDLNLFNEHRDRVPEFVWSVVEHMKMPIPGDAFGINVVCRVTKADTQGTLDSKHLQTITNSQKFEFNVEKQILDELSLFSNHMQIFELANRRDYATVFMSEDTTLQYLMTRLPDACYLYRGLPFNKGVSASGSLTYLQFFRFILVEDRGSVKVLYRSLTDLFALLRCVPMRHVVAFSDVRNVFKKCGITCTFFNMIQVARRQLFTRENPRYEKDITTLLTFMFCRGELLPMNREGLAKTKDRPPIDVLSFEAMKRNCARLTTGPHRGEWRPVRSSLEKIFMGEQFNEGTGYRFELYGDPLTAHIPAAGTEEFHPLRPGTRKARRTSPGSSKSTSR